MPVNDPASALVNPIPGPAEVPTGTPRRLLWWVHLSVLTSYLVVVGLLGTKRAGNHHPVLTHTAGGLLLVCGIEAAIFALVFGLAWLASRATRDDLLLHWRGGFWTFPLGVAYSVALRIGLGIIIGVGVVLLAAAHIISLEDTKHFVQANRPDLETIVDMSALRHNPVYLALTLTVVSFGLAGFREELWRAAFLAGLRRLWPNVFGSTGGGIAGITIAAVVFGLGHLAMGLTAVCMAGLLGFGLGLIMVLHRSIWPAVIAHGMFDATTFALLPLLIEQLRGISS